MKVTVFMIIVGIIFLCIFVGLLTLIVRALLKYIHSKDVRQEKSVVCATRSVRELKVMEHSAK